jgi:uncharacterized protein
LTTVYSGSRSAPTVRGVIVVVFAQLGREGVSIISMRPASRNERKLYEER